MWFFALFKAVCKTFLDFEQNMFVMLNVKCWLKTLLGTIIYNNGSRDVIEARIYNGKL